MTLFQQRQHARSEEGMQFADLKSLGAIEIFRLPVCALFALL